MSKNDVDLICLNLVVGSLAIFGGGGALLLLGNNFRATPSDLI